jgi:hypothetical protein
VDYERTEADKDVEAALVFSRRFNSPIPRGVRGVVLPINGAPRRDFTRFLPQDHHDRARRLVPDGAEGVGAQVLSRGTWYSKGVSVDGIVRSSVGLIHLPVPGKKQYTTAFCKVVASRLSRHVRGFVGVGSEDVVVVGVEHFFAFRSSKLDIDGVPATLARVRVYPTTRDPVYNLPVLDLREYELDWVLANALGDVIGLGPGNGGLPNAGHGLWTVLSTSDRHVLWGP